MVQIVHGFVKMNRIYFFILFLVIPFSGYSNEDIKIKGAFKFIPTSQDISFRLSQSKDSKDIIKIKLENNAQCIFKISKKTAPQQIRGRDGIIRSETSSTCLVNSKENIILIDIFYKFSKYKKIIGKVQLTTNLNSYLFKFK